MGSLHRVLQGAVLQIHLDHVAASGFHCFLDGDRHFTRLAATETNPAVTIADYGEGGESEDTAAFDHFRNTVDLDQFLLEVAFHLLLFLLVERHISTLEFQSTFTGGVGQGLDTSMVLVTRAVERYTLYASGLGTLSDQLANSGCGIDIAGSALAQVCVQS